MATVHDGNGGTRTQLDIPRRDWYRIAGVFFGVFGLVTGVCVPLLLATFPTKYDVALTHAAQDKETAKIASDLALEVQRAELQYQSTISTITDVKAMAIAQHANTTVLMNRAQIPRRKIEPLPAGMSIDSFPSE